MKIGYARVSTGKQTLRMQRQELKKAGCEKIFADSGISGSAVSKPEYEKALAFAREGDELVVFKLDRLSRKLSFLIDEIARIEKLGLSFSSLHERIETVSPAGKLFFHMVGAFAQFEKDQLQQRTRAGLAAARRAGKRLGRPKTISDKQWEQAQALLNADPPASVTSIARLLNVSRQTVYNRMGKADADGTIEE